jgi:hypothetical protein
LISTPRPGALQAPGRALVRVQCADEPRDGTLRTTIPATARSLAWFHGPEPVLKSAGSYTCCGTNEVAYAEASVRTVRWMRFCVMTALAAPKSAQFPHVFLRP